MGEGESSSVRRRIQPLWKLRETRLAVPSPVRRERVRVRAVLFEMRFLSGNCFCTNTKCVAEKIYSPRPIFAARDRDRQSLDRQERADFIEHFCALTNRTRDLGGQ